MRIAFSGHSGYASVNPEVAHAVAASVRKFEALGATVVEASPGLRRSDRGSRPVPLGWRLWYPELATMRDKMDPGFVQAVEKLATRTLFDTSKARLVRLDVAATMGRFFGQYDLLVTPTMADVAFGLVAQRCGISRRSPGAHSRTHST